MAKLLIGITGSIAAIKLPLLIHKLTQCGHECNVVISQEGLNFVTPMAISSMGADVYIDNNTNINSYTDVMQHINLGKWADYILICPASANSIAKLNTGIADNLLTQTVLASEAPIILVPAMNSLMWKNKKTQQNITSLQQSGYMVWGPGSGLQACGDNDVGRMLEIDEIADKINELTTTKTTALNGKHIVITAGGTKEMIDPVRYISNYSSGKMAYALAEHAVKMGAQVSLISAASLPAPSGVTLIPVSSSGEMLEASLQFASGCDIFIGAAAVCDYTIANYATQKIKKQSAMQLNLVPTADILKTLRSKYPKLFIAGFAAETDNVIKHAQAKLTDKQLDLIIANDVSNNQVFNQDTNKVTVITKDFKRYDSVKDSKSNIAKFILQYIITEYSKHI